MSLINALVDSIEDLEDRFSLRTEFMRMGFQDTLSVRTSAATLPFSPL